MYDLARTILGLEPIQRPGSLQLDEPSPGTSWEVFFILVEEQLHRFGVCYLWNASDPGMPVELMVLHTSSVFPQRDASGGVTGYVVEAFPRFHVMPIKTKLHPGEVLMVRRGDNVRQKVRAWLDTILSGDPERFGVATVKPEG